MLILINCGDCPQKQSQLHPCQLQQFVIQNNLECEFDFKISKVDELFADVSFQLQENKFNRLGFLFYLVAVNRKH